jgi:hypothetical protein
LGDSAYIGAYFAEGQIARFAKHGALVIEHGQGRAQVVGDEVSLVSRFKYHIPGPHGDGLACEEVVLHQIH